jgi:hypothetical protein
MKYDDIININYSSIKKSKMSLEQRSAQFAPYQALEGYMDNVYESERITDKKIELSEEEKEIINKKIIFLYNNKLSSTFTYFIKDNKKSGGYYKKIKSTIIKIDYINKELILENKFKLKMEDLIDIE